MVWQFIGLEKHTATPDWLYSWGVSGVIDVVSVTVSVEVRVMDLVMVAVEVKAWVAVMVAVVVSRTVGPVLVTCSTLGLASKPVVRPVESPTTRARTTNMTLLFIAQRPITQSITTLTGSI